MSNTMGKQFTAGHDTSDLRKTVLNLNTVGFGAMIDYQAEMKENCVVTEDVIIYKTYLILKGI